ncbi:MAG: ComEA family DNA-binding protein [Actinobacteria bacterium]|nr:ComEA family DNA-binding protein [Actinomycetota bacterium]MCI0544917.1 ComEA family DNA-binding protein [Actinomycetota bacterium]MCI0678893.1 ComEA family DNA-binding protein [Actinomycetota bacterium]
MGETNRRRTALFMIVAGAGLGVVVGIGQREPPPTGPVPEVVIPPTMIEVHVGGWVMSPGVVSLRQGSILADAVMAAGGFKPGATTEAVNLAAPLSDGQQIIVPGPSSSDPVGSGGTDDGRISLNTATTDELEGLPGVGPVLAERIVAYREQNGPFTVVEDLLGVSGIGEAKLATIRDLVTVP